MMGGLHIEMAFQEMFGKWIGGSAWDVKFAEAGVGILTPGRTHLALDATSVKQTRYAHEVSCVALFILREEAFLDNAVQRSYCSRDAWCELMKYNSSI